MAEKEIPVEKTQVGVIGNELMKSPFWKKDAIERGECDEIQELPDGTGLMFKIKKLEVAKK